MRAELKVEGIARRVEGPLLFLERTVNVGLNEAVQVIGGDGVERLGRVATLDEDSMIVEVLESTAGLGVRDTVLSVQGEPVCFDVGPNMLGRVFDSVGRPLDGQSPVPAMRRLRIDGMTINPARRALPRDFHYLDHLVRQQVEPSYVGFGQTSHGAHHSQLATTDFAVRENLLRDPVCRIGGHGKADP